MHCHMTHHVMSLMGHGLPPMTGVDTTHLDERLRRVVPGTMSMGTEGMGGMGEMAMDVPANSRPMRGGPGPLGYIDMGGMFTLLKVRRNPRVADETGWFAHPQGSVATQATPQQLSEDGIEVGG